jgi:hypothetical protein
MDLTHRFSERRRERRSKELRRNISGPSEFRDPVQDVLKPRGRRVREEGYEGYEVGTAL